MAIGVVSNESTVALVAESTEGTYVAPSNGDGSEYVEVLSNGLEFNKAREELTRNTLGGSVESVASRVGIADVTGSLSVEMRAAGVEGDAPQSSDVLLRSLLGGKRQIAADQTSGTTHTSTVINFADTSAFSVGDIVLVKEAGAYECRPISAIVTNTSIEFPFALDNGAPTDAVVVAQVTTYYSDASNAISFSAEHNLGTAAIKQQVSGLRAASGSISNWSVGALPQMDFGVQGLNIVRVDQDATEAAVFSDALPPVALSACVWISGTKVSYTEAALSIENTISTLTDACTASGKISSRITEQVTTFSVNPYLDDTDLTNTWDKFEDNNDVSVFMYAYNPDATAGEFSNAVAVWLPQAKIIASPVADQDGIITEALEIKAHRSSGSTGDSVYISFI